MVGSMRTLSDGQTSNAFKPHWSLSSNATLGPKYFQKPSLDIVSSKRRGRGRSKFLFTLKVNPWIRIYGLHQWIKAIGKTHGLNPWIIESL